MFFEIKNLKVKPAEENTKGKTGRKENSTESEILKGVNLKVKKGETHALLGPNGSGKSALVQTILGNPKYKITEGKIIFKNKNIINLTPDKKTKMGIALAWQNTPNIRGVSFSKIIEEIENKTKNKEHENILKKEIGSNLSGGEKKIAEIEQIISLNPELVILDEIDSGLDMKKVKVVAEIIKEKLVSKKVSIILITHSGEILNFLKPDTTSVLVNGKIICSQKSHKKVMGTINKYGYENCKKHELSTHK